MPNEEKTQFFIRMMPPALDLSEIATLSEAHEGLLDNGKGIDNSENFLNARASLLPGVNLSEDESQKSQDLQNGRNDILIQDLHRTSTWKKIESNPEKLELVSTEQSENVDRDNNIRKYFSGFLQTLGENAPVAISMYRLFLGQGSQHYGYVGDDEKIYRNGYFLGTWFKQFCTLFQMAVYGASNGNYQQLDTSEQVQKNNDGTYSVEFLIGPTNFHMKAAIEVQPKGNGIDISVKKIDFNGEFNQDTNCEQLPKKVLDDNNLETSLKRELIAALKQLVFITLKGNQLIIQKGENASAIYSINGPNSTVVKDVLSRLVDVLPKLEGSTIKNLISVLSKLKSDALDNLVFVLSKSDDALAIGRLVNVFTDRKLINIVSKFDYFQIRNLLFILLKCNAVITKGLINILSKLNAESSKKLIFILHAKLYPEVGYADVRAAGVLVDVLNNVNAPADLVNKMYQAKSTFSLERESGFSYVRKRVLDDPSIVKLCKKFGSWDNVANIPESDQVEVMLFLSRYSKQAQEALMQLASNLPSNDAFKSQLKGFIDFLLSNGNDQLKDEVVLLLCDHDSKANSFLVRMIAAAFAEESPSLQSIEQISHDYMQRAGVKSQSIDQAIGLLNDFPDDKIYSIPESPNRAAVAAALREFLSEVNPTELKNFSISKVVTEMDNRWAGRKIGWFRRVLDFVARHVLKITPTTAVVADIWLRTKLNQLNIVGNDAAKVFQGGALKQAVKTALDIPRIDQAIQAIMIQFLVNNDKPKKVVSEIENICNRLFKGRVSEADVGKILGRVLQSNENYKNRIDALKRAVPAILHNADVGKIQDEALRSFAIGGALINENSAEVADKLAKIYKLLNGKAGKKCIEKVLSDVSQNPERMSSLVETGAMPDRPNPRSLNIAQIMLENATPEDTDKRVEIYRLLEGRVGVVFINEVLKGITQDSAKMDAFIQAIHQVDDVLGECITTKKITKIGSEESTKNFIDTVNTPLLQSRIRHLLWQEMQRNLSLPKLVDIIIEGIRVVYDNFVSKNTVDGITTIDTRKVSLILQDVLQTKERIEVVRKVFSDQSIKNITQHDNEVKTKTSIVESLSKSDKPDEFANKVIKVCQLAAAELPDVTASVKDDIVRSLLNDGSLGRFTTENVQVISQAIKRKRDELHVKSSDNRILECTGGAGGVGGNGGEATETAKPGDRPVQNDINNKHGLIANP